MAEITTNNLISTPNITGNISTCKTEIEIIDCAKNNYLFVCTDVGYATNNCSGKTDVYENWDLTGISIFLIISIISICIFYAVRKILKRY
jgi:hypothetical protein